MLWANSASLQKVFARLLYVGIGLLINTQPGLALDPGIDYLQKGVQAYGASKNKESLAFLDQAIKTMPQDPFVLLARADVLLSMNRPREALKELNQALKISRYKGGTHSRLGLCYLEMKQPALAEKELELSTQLNELDILRWAPWLDYLNLAAAKQGLRKYKEADPIRVLGNRMRLQQQAREQREALDLPNAMTVADQAVQVKPDNIYSHYMRGVIRLNGGAPAKSIEDFSMIIKKQPNDPVSYYYRADGYLDCGKLEEAIKDYSKIISLASPVVAVVDVAETGRCKTSGKSYDESAVTLEDIYYLRASAYRHLNKLSLARADVNTCLKMAPTDLDAKVMNVDLLNAEGKKKEAMAELQRLVKENPKDNYCLQLAATAYSELGDLDKALETANKLVSASMGETNALLCRAKILERQGKWQNSISDYSLAIKNDDFNDDARAGRARAYGQIGDWQNALKDCNAAIKSADKPLPEMLQLKAKALQKLGAKVGQK